MTGSRAELPARIVPIGDSAVLAILAEDPDPLATAWAHALAAAIDAERPDRPGLGRAVPAHASVLVPFDPLAMTATAVAELVGDRLRTAARSAEPLESVEVPIEIGVRYGGIDGPDLEGVAAIAGLSPAQVVELHAGAAFRVLFLGFAPGFAYLGGLPAALTTPRRATPRERVPAGSVAIAGEHSAVYPLAMPGGWNLIGRTDATLFDPLADPPARFRPGARVRFVPLPSDRA